MAYQYHDLPLVPIQYKEGGEYYSTVKAAEGQAAHDMQQASYCMSGTGFILERNSIRSKVQKQLFYLQDFMIMDADEHYFMDRSHLASYELRFTLEGKGQLEYRGRTYLLAPGEGYWIDCRQPHRYYTKGTHWRSAVMYFNGPAVPLLYERFQLLENVKLTDQTHQNFEIFLLQCLQPFVEQDPLYEYQTSCRLDILCTNLLTDSEQALRKAESGEIMTKVLQYVYHNYASDLSLDRLTKQFGISRTVLCQEFKKRTGYTFKQYLLTLRIDQAVFLLKTTRMSIDEICESVGFHDTVHFIKMFKKRMGETPLQFRKLHPLLIDQEQRPIAFPL